jgi:transcriptional regulator of acetoin/glycerol metabolism
MTVAHSSPGVLPHAHRIFDAVQRGPDPSLDATVVSSWLRCVQDYRLHPERLTRPPVLTSAELQARCDRLADLIDCARHEMTTLFQQLGDPHTAVVLTDPEGVIVHMASSPEFERELAPFGFQIGGVWSEAEAGTNGMGTCLAAARPIAVKREDHFFSQFTDLTCSAVPIRDPAGRVAAALDVTSRSLMPQQHALVLLGMTARMIENRLLDLRFRNAHPLHFHSRPEFVYTLHEGRLAVADDGSILAANESALFQLGLESPEQIRSRRIEDLFQTSLADLLERSNAASFHPVVTYRTRASNRFYAVVRQPAAEPAPRQGLKARLLRSEGATTGLPAPATPPSPAEPTFTDPALQALLHTGVRVIGRRTPLLLHGETGVGKEVFARTLHARSPAAAGAFVAINCASIPETLIEAELFGYRAGAFTGAERRGRRGKIAQADGGTLFLDEIGDMPLDLQARLLRVLDERQVTPLGSEESQPVEFQLVSGSHRDLTALVREGRFREDLYYRLCGIELKLPALRERSDRDALITAILHEEAGAPAQLAEPARRALLAHPWPGNVRQLRHVLRTAAALADGPTIGLAHLPFLGGPTTPSAAEPPSAGTPPAEAPDLAGLNPIETSERQVLLRLLEQQRWNMSKVAQSLTISRNTLYRKLHKLRIPISK